MKPVTVTVSASADGPSHSAIYVPDRHENPFNISIGADVATTAHFTILHTFQDPQRTAAADLVWYPHDLIVAASADIDGNYAYPVAGIRVQCSVASEGGVSVTFIQAGQG